MTFSSQFCYDGCLQLDIENSSAQKVWQVVEFVFGERCSLNLQSHFFSHDTLVLALYLSLKEENHVDLWQFLALQTWHSYSGMPVPKMGGAEIQCLIHFLIYS